MRSSDEVTVASDATGLEVVGFCLLEPIESLLWSALLTSLEAWIPTISYGLRHRRRGFEDRGRRCTADILRPFLGSDDFSHRL